MVEKVYKIKEEKSTENEVITVEWSLRYGLDGDIYLCVNGTVVAELDDKIEVVYIVPPRTKELDKALKLNKDESGWGKIKVMGNKI